MCVSLALLLARNCSLLLVFRFIAFNHLHLNISQAAAFYFRQETVDPVSGQAVHKKLNLQSFHASLQSKLLKAKSAKDSRVLVLGFADLLQKCLTLDPTRRIPVKVALQHDFFFKDTTTTTGGSSSGNTNGGKKKT